MPNNNNNNSRTYYTFVFDNDIEEIKRHDDIVRNVCTRTRVGIRKCRWWGKRRKSARRTRQLLVGTCTLRAGGPMAGHHEPARTYFVYIIKNFYQRRTVPHVNHSQSPSNVETVSRSCPEIGSHVHTHTREHSSLTEKDIFFFCQTKSNGHVVQNNGNPLGGLQPRPIAKHTQR